MASHTLGQLLELARLGTRYVYTNDFCGEEPVYGHRCLYGCGETRNA